MIDASSDSVFGLFCGQLGNILEKNGQHDAAIDLHKTCLAIFLKLGDKETAASAHQNLGAVFKLNGKYEEALVEYPSAAAIDKEIHGEDNPDVATTYSAIAEIYQCMEKYDESLAEV